MDRRRPHARFPARAEHDWLHRNWDLAGVKLVRVFSSRAPRWKFCRYASRARSSIHRSQSRRQIQGQKFHRPLFFPLGCSSWWLVLFPFAWLGLGLTGISWVAVPLTGLWCVLSLFLGRKQRALADAQAKREASPLTDIA